MAPQLGLGSAQELLLPIGSDLSCEATGARCISPMRRRCLAPPPERATQPPPANKALPAPGHSRLQPQPRLPFRQPVLLLLNTDRLYYRVFQSAPVLIRALLPGSASAPPSSRLLQVLLQEVHWISLEELSRQPNLDLLLNLLTLPVRPQSELVASSQQILASRPDLETVVLSLLVQQFPQLT